MKMKLIGTLTGAVILATVPAQAANWSLALGNWTTDAAAGWGTEPTAGDIANIFGGIVEITAGNAEVAAELRLGNAAVDTGTLNMSGGSLTHANANVGLDGVGVVNITGGFINSAFSVAIGGGPTSVGTVTVDGSGASWGSSNALFVGNLGSGSLTITNGGSFSNVFSQIGRLASGNGSVTVTGAGSTWVHSGTSQIGATGTGEVTISDGGYVYTPGTIHVGANPGSDGAITVTGVGSLYECGSNLLIGHNTANGALSITNGGSVTTSNGNFIIANSVSSTGTVTVTGSGSSLTLNGNTIIGANDGGLGMLNIVNGGTVVASQSPLSRLGLNEGTVSSVTVEGSGSSWDTSLLEIGWSATNANAILSIADGGLVLSTNLYISAAATNAVIEMGAGGMLALLGDGSASIAAFLGLLQNRVDAETNTVFTTDNIDYWNGVIFADLSGAALGDDVSLVHHTSGDLDGYTLLTVFTNVLEVGDLSLTIDGADAIIGWDGTVGTNYTLQSDTDLVLPPSWSDVETGIPGVAGSMSATSTTAAAESFYRVIIE